MNQTLKKLIKPPFDWFYIKYDKVPEHDYAGIFHGLRDYAKAALNEKYARDFTEPMRWILVEDYGEGIQILKCEKCGEEILFESLEVSRNYCPNCGQRLLAPEPKKEQE